MIRDEVVKALQAHKVTLARRFGVRELALFGSIVRNQASLDSDVDILVTFQGHVDWRRYFDLQFYLEDLLDRPVDLVNDKARRPELRNSVEREALRV